MMRYISSHITVTLSDYKLVHELLNHPEHHDSVKVNQIFFNDLNSTFCSIHQILCMTQ